MDVDKIIKQLPPAEILYYFGFTGFAIESEDNFEEAQVGYRTHLNGEDLIGSGAGDWQQTWYVIGRDTIVGDPFFVDLGSEGLAVYTAIHGTGSWEPDLVSTSLEGYISAVQFLQQKSGQDSDLIEPDENTIRDEKALAAILSRLIALCGQDAHSFWENFIEFHQDWIEESE